MNPVKFVEDGLQKLLRGMVCFRHTASDLGQSVTLFGLINYNLKTINLIKPKPSMVRPCSFLCKLQKVHKKSYECFHGKGITSSCVAISRSLR